MKKQVTNKLFQYAAAAGAGAFSVSSAQAAIVNQSFIDTFTGITLGSNAGAGEVTTFTLDINGDLSNDFTFNYTNSPRGFLAITHLNGGETLSPNGGNNNYLFGFIADQTIDDSALDPTELGANSASRGGTNSPASVYAVGANNYILNSSGNGYIGVEFDNGGNRHFGWVNVAVTYTALETEFSFEISGYAWEDSVATGINAGAVPEPSNFALGLGLLALGAAGVRSRRKSA
jgi:MYXO-CTERM domain-containing protein